MFVNTGSVESSCPALCQCCIANVNDTIVDCSRIMASEIPKRLPTFTTIADFSNHNITVLPSRAFEGCFQLKILDISNGKLGKISSTSFATLFSLRSLSLNNNSLDFSQTTSVENDVFNDLINLVDLKLENNKKSFAHELAIRNDLFAKLSNLRNISIDFPDKITLSGDITWILRLNKLDIFGGLKKVFNDTFAPINQTCITYLGIHSPVMEDLEALAFAHFPCIEVLNFSYTQNLGFANVSKAWYGLRYKPLKVLDLTWILTIKPLNINKIHSAFFNYLNFTKITEVYIDSNEILIVEKGIHKGLPKLRSLSMTNNRLCLYLENWLDFCQLKFIRRLDGNFQLKRMLQRRDTDKSLSYLSRPTLYKSDTLYNLTSYNLQRKNNKKMIQSLPNNARYYNKPLPSTYGLKTFPFILPRCLQEIKMAQIASENNEDMPNLYFMGYIRLKLLNYSNNGFSAWNNVVRFAIPPRHKITLDLSKNGCGQMSPRFLRYSCPYFDKLFFAHNQLGISLSMDTSGELFKSCFELKVLDLADNDIKLLPQHLFINMTKLQFFNLSKNSLRTLNVTITNMPDLELLDLSSNLLGFLGNDALQQLDFLVNLTVDLTDNPFICDCQSLYFLRWASKHKKRLRNFRYYQCFFNSENKYKIFNTFEELDTSILPSLTLRCSSSDYVKYVFFLATLLLLAMLMVLCGKKYYWDIKFCLLDLSYRRRNYMRIIEQQQAEKYKFAAFVAFEKGDRTWIDEQLIPALQTPDFKLYIYPEQFLSGYIEDNIMRGLQECHKVILVLSRHFVNSEWCLLEARMAFHRCLDTGFDLIIPILLENISTEVIRKLVKF